MAWQDSMVAIYQNFMHAPDVTVVGSDGSVSSPPFGVGYELENALNLIPSRPMRFATAKDPRFGAAAGPTKIVRFSFPRTLTFDCVALINVHSNATTPSGANDIDTEKLVKFELFHGLGSANYGQGTGSPGTAIGSAFTMNATDIARYGANLFFKFNAQVASILTFRFSNMDNTDLNTGFSIGNILAGRAYDFPAEAGTEGWPMITPARKMGRRITGRSGRTFGAVQIETRYPTVRTWMINTLWRQESLREDFERYWSNRDMPRMDGTQNQYLKKRLDLPTALVHPQQWAGSSSPYASPVFGMFGDEMETTYDSMANAILTSVEFQEIG